MGETTIGWCRYKLPSGEWRSGYTFNAWLGCARVSRACKHCYISRTPPFRLRGIKHGDARQRTAVSTWKQPIAWNRKAAVAGSRPRVFCNSLADWLDDEVPAEWLADLLELIHDTPHLDWLLLTKRPENFSKRMLAAAAVWANLAATRRDMASKHELVTWLYDWFGGNPPKNVGIGVTVENQSAADFRIPLLIAIPALLRFISCEPLLEDLDLSPWLWKSGCEPHCGEHCTKDADCPLELLGLIHWIIGGGESGDEESVEPTTLPAARGLRDQSLGARVPFYWKQWGEWIPLRGHRDMLDIPRVAPGEKNREWRDAAGGTVCRVGTALSGRLLDGVLHDEFPEGVLG